MDIVEFIKKIQVRPQTFIGELNFKHLQFYISGFLINNYFHDRLYDTDNKFKCEFIDYTIQYVFSKYNTLPSLSKIDKNNSRGYGYFIENVEENEKNKIYLFFEIFNNFFKINQK